MIIRSKPGFTGGVAEFCEPRKEGGIYRRIPVKTAGDIPKGMIFEIMDEINKVVVKAPIKVGDVIIENVLGTGVNVVSAKTM